MRLSIDTDSYLCSPLVPAQPEPIAQSEAHGLASPGTLSNASSPPEANGHQLCPPGLTGMRIRPSSQCPGTLVRSLGSGPASDSVSQNGRPQVLIRHREAGEGLSPASSQAMATPIDCFPHTAMLSLELSSPAQLWDCSGLTERKPHTSPMV